VSRYLLLALLLGCNRPGEVPVVDTTVVEPEDTGDEILPYQPDPIDLESAASCGECHPRQYEEWETSMHAYAAQSPVFDAMALKAYRDSSGEVGTFCTGCHSVQGTLAGEPGDTQADERSDFSREGITCDICHTAVAHEIPIGNTSLLFETDGPKQGPYESSSTSGHESELGEFTSSPELCGSCHDVFNFPGLRIEEAYTEYVESPAAAEGVRCQDCHMGPEPGVAAEREWGPSADVLGESYPDREMASHLFVGPDYSLIDAFPYADDLEASAAWQSEYLGKVQTLLENSVQISSLDASDISGELHIEVELESLTSGHNVPTGFTSERQLWIEVLVTDESGEVLASSGQLDSYGDLPDTHSWDVQSGALELDEQLANLQSKNLVRHGTQEDWREGEYEGIAPDLEIKETVFPFDANTIVRRSLEPLEKRSYSYEFDEPSGEYEVRVRLRYRNLPPYLLRSLQLTDLVERLVIFDLDEQSLSSEEI
jgi:nitrate/TMAO reductase-like tetraheme cytochrome c subunit